MKQNDNNLSFERMLQITAQRLHTTPEALKAAAQNGEMDQILAEQSGGQSEQLKRALSDPKEAQKLLNNPAIQKLLEQMQGK